MRYLCCLFGYVLLFSWHVDFAIGNLKQDANATLSSQCPSSFYENADNGFCYKAVFRTLNYDEANALCLSEGGFLANIPSHRINYFIYELIYQKYGKRFEHHEPIKFWIGLNDREQKGTFVWSRAENGMLENGKYSNWYPEEKKNGSNLPYDPDHIKNCVTWSWSLTPGWNAHNCSKKFYFLCQIDVNRSTTELSSSASAISTTDFTAKQVRVSATKIVVAETPFQMNGYRSTTVLSSSASTTSTTDFTAKQVRVPATKIAVAETPILLIVLTCIGVALCLLVLLLMLLFWYLKKQSEKKRSLLLKQTGIFTAPVAKPTLPKVVWTTNTSSRQM